MLSIRKAKKQDLSKLAEIYIRAYDRAQFGEIWKKKAAVALLIFYFNQKKFLGLTAVLDGKVVGGLFSFIKPWHDGNHLGEGELFVDPDYQGKKIGTELMFKMMLLAKSKKCVVHELIAYAGVTRWYRKLGMKDTGLTHMDGKIDVIIKKLKI
jgi:GNAT superfamily N-acetyltransferase